MRVGRTLLLVLPLALGVSVAAHARILGAGKPAKSDCYMTFEGINATRKTNIVECIDNDPCDADLTLGQCGFSFTVCVAQTDTGIAGCSPGQVTKIKGKGLMSDKLPTLPASAPACGPAPNVVTLKLKRNGKPAKRLLNLLALATGSPKRDGDQLRLKCLPRPSSTPQGAFVTLD
jgi:hypothetical protein